MERRDGKSPLVSPEAAHMFLRARTSANNGSGEGNSMFAAFYDRAVEGYRGEGQQVVPHPDGVDSGRGRGYTHGENYSDGGEGSREASSGPERGGYAGEVQRAMPSSAGPRSGMREGGMQYQGQGGGAVPDDEEEWRDSYQQSLARAEEEWEAVEGVFSGRAYPVDDFYPLDSEDGGRDDGRARGLTEPEPSHRGRPATALPQRRQRPSFDEVDAHRGSLSHRYPIETVREAPRQRPHTAGPAAGSRGRQDGRRARPGTASEGRPPSSTSYGYGTAPSYPPPLSTPGMGYSAYDYANARYGYNVPSMHGYYPSMGAASGYGGWGQEVMQHPSTNGMGPYGYNAYPYSTHAWAGGGGQAQQWGGYGYEGGEQLYPNHPSYQHPYPAGAGVARTSGSGRGEALPERPPGRGNRVATESREAVEGEDETASRDSLQFFEDGSRVDQRPGHVQGEAGQPALRGGAEVLDMERPSTDVDDTDEEEGGRGEAEASSGRGMGEPDERPISRKPQLDPISPYRQMRRDQQEGADVLQVNSDEEASSVEEGSAAARLTTADAPAAAVEGGEGGKHNMAAMFRDFLAQSAPPLPHFLHQVLEEQDRAEGGADLAPAEKELGNVLMSWYYAGYFTGRYRAMMEGETERADRGENGTRMQESWERAATKDELSDDFDEGEEKDEEDSDEEEEEVVHTILPPRGSRVRDMRREEAEEGEKEGAQNEEARIIGESIGEEGISGEEGPGLTDAMAGEEDAFWKDGRPPTRGGEGFDLGSSSGLLARRDGEESPEVLDIDEEEGEEVGEEGEEEDESDVYRVYSSRPQGEEEDYDEEGEEDVNELVSRSQKLGVAEVDEIAAARAAVLRERGHGNEGELSVQQPTELTEEVKKERIALVVVQCHVSESEARATLEANNWDVVNAIMAL